MKTTTPLDPKRAPWNKGRLTGQKPPLKLNEIWAIRTRLQLTTNVRELAMFNLAIDSKLRACDLTRLRVQDISAGSQVGARATVMQQKTQPPVQFEITEQTRQSVQCWIQVRGLKLYDYLFPSRLHASPHQCLFAARARLIWQAQTPEDPAHAPGAVAATPLAINLATIVGLAR